MRATLHLVAATDYHALDAAASEAAPEATRHALAWTPAT
jgi:hypothetical protein